MNVDERFYELAAHLWRAGSYAYYWTPNSQTTEGEKCAYAQWLKVAEIEPVSDNLRNVNVYFGIHPSHTLKRSNERTSIVDIAAVNCLFAEFDLVDGQNPDHLLESINQIDIVPSVIVFSGGGYHCYWLLDSPYRIYGDDSRTWIIDLQYAWVDSLDADRGAKDIARVLRVPGTKNLKSEYGPEFPTVEFKKFEMSTVYTFEELRHAVEPILAANKKKERVDKQIASVNVPIDLKDRLEKMLHDDAGAAALWEGDLSAYKNDASAGDLALCNKLAFWFGRDKTIVDLMFRKSKLMRDKWDRENYRNNTLNMAIDDTGKVYDPSTYYNNLNGDPQSLINPSLNSTAGGAQATTNGTTAQSGASTSQSTQSSQSTQGKPTPQATKGKISKSAGYIQTLTSFGYTFKLNDLDNTIEINGVLLDDVVSAEIRTKMRDAGYDDMRAIEDAYIAHASTLRYHPIKDYLRNLAWDGTDWIKILAGLFTDIHPLIEYADGKKEAVFYVWLKRWLIGAVAKVFDQAQNPMLVIDGIQDLGKSTFALWLGSNLSAYVMEGGIKPDNENHLRYLAVKWIWEAGEVGATTKRQDVEALKNFLTMRETTFRKPYDRHVLKKPTLTSFIGTLNNENGFLVDTTGNRRYLSVNVTHIDHEYQKIVPVDQLWAQVYAIWNAGSEPHRLLPEEIEMRNLLNAGYQMEDTCESWVLRYYDVDPDELNWKTTTQEVTAMLQHKEYKGETGAVQRAVGRTLKALKLSQDQNARPRTWKGIRQKSAMP